MNSDDSQAGSILVSDFIDATGHILGPVPESFFENKDSAFDFLHLVRQIFDGPSAEIKEADRGRFNHDSALQPLSWGLSLGAITLEQLKLLFS